MLTNIDISSINWLQCIPVWLWEIWQKCFGSLQRRGEKIIIQGVPQKMKICVLVSFWGEGTTLNLKWNKSRKQSQIEIKLLMWGVLNPFWWDRGTLHNRDLALHYYKCCICSQRPPSCHKGPMIWWYDDVIMHFTCFLQVSRSATVILGYLMLQQDYSYDEAFSLVKAGRPSIRPNQGFVEQLRKLEQQTAGSAIEGECN